MQYEEVCLLCPVRRFSNVTLIFGISTFSILTVLVGRTYHPMPLMVFYSIFPIIIGLYLALPNLISKVQRPGRWTIGWIKLITVGSVSLILALAPVLYWLSPIGKQAPRLVLWLIEYNQGSTIAGVVFGYLILSVLNKVTEER